MKAPIFRWSNFFFSINEEREASQRDENAGTVGICCSFWLCQVAVFLPIFIASGVCCLLSLWSSHSLIANWNHGAAQYWLYSLSMGKGGICRNAPWWHWDRWSCFLHNIPFSANTLKAYTHAHTHTHTHTPRKNVCHTAVFQNRKSTKYIQSSTPRKNGAVERGAGIHLLLLLLKEEDRNVSHTCMKLNLAYSHSLLLGF